MKLIRTIMVMFVVTTFALLSAISDDMMLDGGRVIAVDSQVSGNVVENSYMYAPEFRINHSRLSLGSSFYDYFPGSYSSFPIVKQPSPAGVHEGGGLYVVFQMTPVSGGTRRVYYVYIEDGQIISGPSLINLGGSLIEGFPGIDIDDRTGNPFVSWHSPYSSVNAELCNFLIFDQYDMIGTPGLWSESFMVTNNTEIDGTFIWPVVKVGESPTPGMKRLFVMSTNSAEVGLSPQGHNALLSFADFDDATSDLVMYDPEMWTHYEIPYMKNWAAEQLRPYYDFSVKGENVVVAGTLFDWYQYGEDGPGGYSEKDALFVLVNRNYGEGQTESDWEFHTEYANINVGNPDNYFEDDIHIGPFAPRFSMDINDNDEVIYTITYRMSSEQANRLFFNQAYIKYVAYDLNQNRFKITDLYPRSENPEAFPYVPWDPEGDGEWTYTEIDGEHYLDTTLSWPVYWWDDGDYQPENYSRIAQTGRYAVAVFQESMKARLYNEYGDENYQEWSDKPELYIMVSDDYGTNWYDPIIMNANPTDENYAPEFSGMIPSYFYPANYIDELDNGLIRIYLLYYNQNDYGSHLQENGPNTGGSLRYMSVDISLPVSADKYVDIQVPTMLKGNYPNPFNPTTTISYALTEPGSVNLSIYNVKGQLVKTLVNQQVNAGEHFVTWNGKDESGRESGSGLYFYRLTTDTVSDARKMLLVK